MLGPYVPMLSTQKNEIRAFDLTHIEPTPEGYELDGWEFEIRGWDGMPWTLSLPPGVASLEELPRFNNSDACFAHIHETWPHLAP